jgi:eukaryotic translation initiation factor 2C
MEFFEHVKSPPKRLVVYRDGGSDGSFERIRDHEVAAIRAAMCELNRKDQGPCPNGCQSKDPDCQGCKPPKITFVVAQKDHNMRVAPANECDAFKNNVPSGTLVDGFVTSYESSEETFDFLLIPQGGLKGTSKPMHYRVLANENSKSQEDPLTKELLYKITYEMAFQCKFLIDFLVLSHFPFCVSPDESL